MGVPKRRVSRSRKNKRRSIWGQAAGPALIECPRCRELKPAHRLCPACGYYRDRQVLKVKQK